MNRSPDLVINGAYPELMPPGTQEISLLLHRLLDKVERLENQWAGLAPLVEQMPGLVSIATDTVDDLIGNTRHAGIDLELRLKHTLTLVERISRPEVMNTLTNLVNNLDKLDGLLNEGPSLLAMAVDAGDELYATVMRAGFDPEGLVKTGLNTAQETLTMVQTASRAEPMGPWGMMRAFADPDVQRAMGFLLTFARAFGQSLAR